MNATYLIAAISASAINIPHKTANQLLTAGTNLFLFAMGILAVIVIIIAGYIFVTNGDKPASVTKARNAILFAVIGLVVVIVAKAIVTFITGSF